MRTTSRGCRSESTMQRTASDNPSASPPSPNRIGCPSSSDDCIALCCRSGDVENDEIPSTGRLVSSYVECSSAYENTGRPQCSSRHEDMAPSPPPPSRRVTRVRGARGSAHRRRGRG
eukprot:CAMPEP_0113586296 /NCGR_PEP_ID=MMETSP0015_2-20120614/34220_1 /TAXON_ID=2838 /ORGANISM="Odontella" /LENGTH=116 /DNA_ID=CAMNT_0000491721 /DNA_START=35 /DNA_END=381 /DNA_ORIENTATION=+ /assembly_acc=CAM_ASM_000160